MDKWEYTQIWLGTMHDEVIHDNSKKFEELGDSGWELVQIIAMQRHSIAIFKRRKYPLI